MLGVIWSNNHSPFKFIINWKTYSWGLNRDENVSFIFGKPGFEKAAWTWVLGGLAGPPAHSWLSSWPLGFPLRRDRPFATWRWGHCPQPAAGWVWKTKNGQKHALWSFPWFWWGNKLFFPREEEERWEVRVCPMSSWAAASWEGRGMKFLVPLGKVDVWKQTISSKYHAFNSF